MWQQQVNIRMLSIPFQQVQIHTASADDQVLTMINKAEPEGKALVTARPQVLPEFRSLDSSMSPCGRPLWLLPAYLNEAS